MHQPWQALQDPWEALAVAILHQAVADAIQGSLPALRWLKTSACAYLANLLGLDPAALQHQLKQTLTPTPPAAWLTIPQAAYLTGYNPEYLRRLARAGHVHARLAGHTWLLHRQALLHHRQNAH
jgi:hypothetical protein